MNVFKDVAAFAKACDIPVTGPFGHQDLLYRKLFAEEAGEISDALVALSAAVRHDETALGNPTTISDPVAYVAALADLADGIVDSIYVLAGWLRVLGLDGEHVWKLVQAANMAKVGEDGKVARRADGKITKPEGWVDPKAAIKLHVAKVMGFVKREVKDLDTTIAKNYDSQTALQAELQQATSVERMFSIEQAALICGVSTTLIREEIAAGNLKSKTFGAKTVRIPESALAAFQA
jgi:predicted HAD superfamily Cof-like phosphohydrolase